MTLTRITLIGLSLLLIHAAVNADWPAIRSPRAEIEYLQSLISEAVQSGTTADPAWQTRIAELQMQLPAQSPAVTQTPPAPLQVQAQTLAELVPDFSDENRDRDPLDQGNDACPASVIGSLPYSDSGSTASSVDNYAPGAPGCAGISSTAANDVIYRYTPTTSGLYRFGACASSGWNPVCYVRTGGACPGTTGVACAAVTNCQFTGKNVYVNLTAGVVYYIIVDGENSFDSGSYYFSADGFAAPADACPSTVISSVPYSQHSTTIGRSDNFSPDSVYSGCYIPSSSGAPDVIYEYTPSDTGYYLAMVCSFTWDGLNYPGWDGICYVRTGGACPGSSAAPCSETRYCTHGTGFWGLLNGGQTYYFIVDGESNQSGDFTFSLQLQCVNSCAGDVIECAETPGASHYTTDCSGGGCNTVGGGMPSYMDVLLGQRICGRLFGYLDPNSTDNQDTDWYRFSLAEPCSVFVNVLSEYPTLTMVGAPGAPCTVLSYYGTSSECEPEVVKTPCLPAGDYQFAIVSYAEGPTYPPRLYNAVVDASPCSGCKVDGTIQAPTTLNEYGTCGAGNDCAFRPGEDRTFRVNIPTAGLWGFSLCSSYAWDSHIYLTSLCCDTATLIAENDNSNGCDGGLSQLCVDLVPGSYYLTVEAADASCINNFLLNVLPCAGRCCYGNPALPSCADNTLSECNALGGAWALAQACASTPCYEYQQCYNSPYNFPPESPLESWSAFASDAEIFGAVYAPYYFGVPVSSVVFYGLGANVHDQNLPCDENPQTFNVRFYQDTVYYSSLLDSMRIPGRLVCSYSLSLTGTPTYLYGEHTQYRYEAILPSPCNLVAGWLSVSGTGSPNCSFFWSSAFYGPIVQQHFERTSFPGHYVDEPLAYCMPEFDLQPSPPDSMVIRLTPGVPDHVTLDWVSPPGSCIAHIYSDTSASAVFPDGYVLVATESTAPGPHTSNPIPALAPCATFVVTLDKCGP